jgi:recombination protein U
VKNIAQNEGKKFEQDFANSVNKNECWLYRLRDNAASFGGSANTRFTSSNVCDYIMFHNKTRTLYLLEMKSTKSSSIPYSMIRENQIKELTESSKHMLVSGFIFNFREKQNATYFMMIDDFNDMTSEINKKSFNITDLEKYGAIKINSNKKRTRYIYDIEGFIKETRLN